MSMDFGLLTNIIHLDIGLAGDIVKAIIIGVTAIAITQNTRHLKLIIFPLLVQYWRLGMDINMAFLIISAIIWVVTIVGAQEIGSALSAIPSAVQETVQAVSGTKQRIRADERLNKYGVKGESTIRKLIKLGYSEKQAINMLDTGSTATKEILAGSKRIYGKMPTNRNMTAQEIIDEHYGKAPVSKATLANMMRGGRNTEKTSWQERAFTNKGIKVVNAGQSKRLPTGIWGKQVEDVFPEPAPWREHRNNYPEPAPWKNNKTQFTTRKNFFGEMGKTFEKGFKEPAAFKEHSKPFGIQRKGYITSDAYPTKEERGLLKKLRRR